MFTTRLPLPINDIDWLLSPAIYIGNQRWLKISNTDTWHVVMINHDNSFNFPRRLIIGHNKQYTSIH